MDHSPASDLARSDLGSEADGVSPTAPLTASPRFAVIMRTYQWDPFIERQVARWREVTEGGDFFLSIDTTRGPVGPTGEGVLATTDADLLALGLPDRWGQGSLIWWNNDYPTYAFHRAHPGYDYYVFVEYDSLIRQKVAPMVAELAAQGIDFVSTEMPDVGENWFWWPHTRRVYEAAEIRASLNCIAFFSDRALRHLFARRQAMANDPAVTHWPISEAFVPTEIARGGFVSAPLELFGDTSAYAWFPPLLEEDLDRMGAELFVHPVLDPPRYLRSAIQHGQRARAYFDPDSAVRRRLARLPRHAWQNRLRRAAWEFFRNENLSRLKRRMMQAGLTRGW